MTFIERATEKTLFASRWLIGPFYLGLVGPRQRPECAVTSAALNLLPRVNRA